MARVLSMLRRQALRKGVRGGDHRWLSVWIVMTGADVVHRLTVARPVRERMELKPGETIVITDLGRLDDT